MGKNKGLGESVNLKSKAQLYVEQANNYLRSIATLSQGTATASVDNNGGCILHDRILSPQEALELAEWLIETFTEKEIEE